MDEFFMILLSAGVRVWATLYIFYTATLVGLPWSWNEMRAKQAGGGGPLTYPLTQKKSCVAIFYY